MSAAVAVCWNCRAPLGEGPQCQTCGARRDPGLRPPAGASGEGRRRAAPGALGPQLRGRAAGVGRRLAAFTCDAALVLAVLVAAAVTTRSPVLVAVLGLEAALALALWEARTGLTVGNALLRLRTSRDDGPMSPGVGRQAARGAVLALGVLAGTVGAWVVVASSAWDPTGRRRSWADRAAGTVVVAVDRRERPARPPSPTARCSSCSTPGSASTCRWARSPCWGAAPHLPCPPT
ncbi:RDD family protein [Cellulomonas citrea]|uniref:RDD family protein n=1 Tax=Cellulomonas citrea TaxID=1909423 RepID=UPI00135C50C3|nr:RDD family protein [Cellulomonas citrea]